MSAFSRTALAAGVLLLTLGAAQARDHGVRAVRHAEDFYAIANSPEQQAPAPASETRGCFTTNSPMEAAKGIRHWSGRC